MPDLPAEAFPRSRLSGKRSPPTAPGLMQSRRQQEQGRARFCFPKVRATRSPDKSTTMKDAPHAYNRKWTDRGRHVGRDYWDSFRPNLHHRKDAERDHDDEHRRKVLGRRD
jgi:hypothetical protein